PLRTTGWSSTNNSLIRLFTLLVSLASPGWNGFNPASPERLALSRSLGVAVRVPKVSLMAQEGLCAGDPMTAVLLILFRTRMITQCLRILIGSNRAAPHGCPRDGCSGRHPEIGRRQTRSTFPRGQSLLLR